MNDQPKNWIRSVLPGTSRGAAAQSMLPLANPSAVAGTVSGSPLPLNGWAGFGMGLLNNWLGNQLDRSKAVTPFPVSRFSNVSGYGSGLVNAIQMNQGLQDGFGSGNPYLGELQKLLGRNPPPMNFSQYF